MRKGWFSIIGNYVLWCREAVCLWVLTKLGGIETGFLVRLMKKTVVAMVTCSLAFGGATVGTISGAIKGQTTETGFLRGSGIGAVAGAITAVQLLELRAQDEPFSKVALLFSLINGKVFREWVTPAVLKAYQWQVSALDVSFSENSDIFGINGGRGLSQDYIKKLPKCKFSPNSRKRPGYATSCIVCLEDFKKGDFIRALPSCGHSFHLRCIDDWLTIHGSCPVCRGDV
ncbi:NEP1-interacting protein 2-like [Rhododendron vialii]|uniref:NEP1-interacting protein 2-like n=1 Tax=Rhododendron vialii TaxID=182163 RepID=UPI00265EAB57|nr:NEP1-interacting protein 2-like [Rhododendron vialii]